MLVLWDHDCGFCAWMLSLFLRCDTQRTLRTAYIQGPAGDVHLAGIAPERRPDSWHVVDADGRLHSGGDALTVVLRALPPTRPLAALTGALPGVTQVAYAYVAAHRSPLSRALLSARAKARARHLVEQRSGE